MTVLNFPNTTGQPTDGSFTYTENGVIYTWNGSYWAANSSEDLDTRYVNVDGDTMTGDLTVPSLNGGPLAGFRNKFINGDYGIAQRFSGYPWTATGVQASPSPTAAYGPDRWGMPQSREFQSRTERPDNEFVGSFQWRIGTGGNAAWSQLIELEADGSSAPRGDFLLECDTWTVSHWIYTADRNNFRCGLIYAEAVYSPNITSSIADIADSDWTIVETKGDWSRVSASFSMTGVAAAPAGALGIRVQFVNDGNIRAVGAQLEPGSVATPFEHRPIGTELALCQRYYNASPTDFAITLCRSALSNTSSSNAYGAISFPQTMRDIPTVTSTVGGGFAHTTASITTHGFRVIASGLATGDGMGMTGYTADAEY